MVIREKGGRTGKEAGVRRLELVGRSEGCVSRDGPGWPAGARGSRQAGELAALPPSQRRRQGRTALLNLTSEKVLSNERGIRGAIFESRGEESLLERGSDGVVGLPGQAAAAAARAWIV